MSIATEPARLTMTADDVAVRRELIARLLAEGRRLSAHEQRVGQLGMWFETSSCAYCNRGYNIFDPSFRPFRGGWQVIGPVSIDEEPRMLTKGGEPLLDLLGRPRYDRALWSRCADKDACEQRKANGYTIVINGEQHAFGPGVGHAQLTFDDALASA